MGKLTHHARFDELAPLILPWRASDRILSWLVTAAFAFTALHPATASGAGPTTAPDPAMSSPIDDSPELMLFKELPIIVAAGKREQSQRQAAASVTVVDADDIQLFGYRSLADVLRDQRGFYLYTDGLNWFAGVRGFLRPGEWNARLLVMVDGRPTRDVIFDQSHLDEDFVVPMETIKRVEIVRGPGSALYGSGAVFGIVNVVTKDGADVNGVEAHVQGGTQDTGRANVLFGARLDNGWDILADAAGYTSQGDNHVHFDGVNDPDHNFGNIDHSDYEGAYAGYIKARKGEFTAELDYESRQKDNRTARYLASFFNPGGMHEERANLTLRVDHDVADGQSIHAMASYSYYLYDQNWRIDDFTGGRTDQYYSASFDDWATEEIHYDWQVNNALHLTTGFDGTQALSTRQHDHDILSGNLLDIHPSFNTWGIFEEGELKVSDGLRLIAGVRLDQVQRIGTSISPRAAAVITPTRDDTVKALYGRAFRAPNLYEMFYAIPGSTLANTRLEPEIVDTFELVWERQNRNGWQTSLDYYLWNMSKALEDITFPSGVDQTRNDGHLLAQGIEGEIQKRWTTGASARAFATLERAVHGDEQLDHSPQWILGSAVVIPVFNKRTFLSIEPQIVGPMKSDLGTYTGPTFITNFVLTSRDFVKGWDLQAGVYNAFGEFARLPHSSIGDHFQPTLNYPSTQLLIGITHRF